MSYNHTALDLGRLESPQSMGFVMYNGLVGRMFSRTAWPLWPCRRTWEIFHQTQREGCQRQTPCSSFPARLHGQTPGAEDSSGLEGLQTSIRLFNL